MADDLSNTTESRRQFLETATALGLTASLLSSTAQADDETKDSAATLPGQLAIVSEHKVRKGSTGDLRLSFKAETKLEKDSRLWSFTDIRQGAGQAQTTNPEQPNFLSVRLRGSNETAATTEMSGSRNWGVRTFDLLPVVPEFLKLIEVTLNQPIEAGQTVDFVIKRWTRPQPPIDPFRFWMVVDHRAEWTFAKLKSDSVYW